MRSLHATFFPPQNFEPHPTAPHLYTFMDGYGILPLRYLSSSKPHKQLGDMSAKVVKNGRFFHLLRFSAWRPSRNKQTDLCSLRLESRSSHSMNDDFVRKRT